MQSETTTQIKTAKGKNNISNGFLTMGLFTGYGFLPIYLRYLAFAKEEWINSYSFEKHFESRLAHMHSFAFLNTLMGYLLLRFSKELNHLNTISKLALLSLLMSIGILLEIHFGFSPISVFVGAAAFTVAVIWMEMSFWIIKPLTTN